MFSLTKFNLVCSLLPINSLADDTAVVQCGVSYQDMYIKQCQYELSSYLFSLSLGHYSESEQLFFA